MSEKPIPLICILGPTASGKTRLAASVAGLVDGEVVSADSRQVYRHMDLGTGKDLGEYLVSGRRIPVHLVDIVDPGYEYNLFEFKRDGVAAIQDIHSRNRFPILCGGTGLYLNALLQDYQLLAVPPNPNRQAELKEKSTEELVAELKTHGPLHNQTDILNRKRLIRAIEIAEAPPASVSPSISLNSCVYGLRWDRSVLRARITKRLQERLESGMIEEVQRLLERGLTPEQLIFYGLEYRFITEYLRGDYSQKEMFLQLNTAIHHFAKRQDTWFRKMEREGVAIHWLDGQESPETNAKIILSQCME